MRIISSLTAAASLSVVIATPAFAAFGDPGVWHSGWGQGTAEYTAVNENGDNIYIACGYEEPVMMTINVGQRSYGNGYGTQGDFSLIIDGSEVPHPYETESHVGADSFLYNWDALRRANSIIAITSDGDRIELPSRGSSNALPEANSREMPCETGFYSS